MKRPIVALGLVTFEPGRTQVGVVELSEAGKADPLETAKMYVENGVSIVAALSRTITPEELVAFIPGVARHPDVEWIAGTRGEGAPS